MPPSEMFHNALPVSLARGKYTYLITDIYHIMLARSIANDASVFWSVFVEMCGLLAEWICHHSPLKSCFVFITMLFFHASAIR